MKKLLVASMVALCSLAAHSEFIEDGNKLYRELRNPDNDLAVGYISGIVDSEEYWRRSSHKDNGMDYACVPSDITATRLTAVVRQYLDDNVQLRHLGAAVLVRLALRHNYPCK